MSLDRNFPFDDFVCRFVSNDSVTGKFLTTFGAQFIAVGIILEDFMKETFY